MEMTAEENGFFEQSLTRAMKFVKKIPYDDLHLEALKTTIKDNYPPLSCTSVMNYWNRPASTVRVKVGREWKAVGYFGGLDRSNEWGFSRNYIVTLTVGIALQLVPRQNSCVIICSFLFIK